MSGILPGHSILCAVSGGTDSTALLLGLKHFEHRYKSLTVAHYNHRARRQASDQDEEFVRALCSRYGFPIQIGRSDRRTDRLDESSGRDARYLFFGATADELSADAIAVAHTIEDQAETVLFRITRGSGVRGASGMRTVRTLRTPSSREITVVRPMLNITHSEADGYLRSLGIVARHDASNEDWKRYARNRIRHRVIPELQALNPEAVSAISRFAEILQVNSELVDQIALDALQEANTGTANIFKRDLIAGLHPAISTAALNLIYRSIEESEVQLDQIHIAEMLDLMSSGKSAALNLPGGITFRTDHAHVSMTHPDEDPIDIVPYPDPIVETCQLPIPGSVDLGRGFRIAASVEPITEDLTIASLNEAWLTPELAKSQGFEVRNRSASDCFNPLGMLQDVDFGDFLIKTKVAASWRDRIPLVIAKETGRIAWVPSIRLAEWAKSRPNHETAVHLKFVRD